jgi:hypothetical protein
VVRDEFGTSGRYTRGLVSHALSSNEQIFHKLAFHNFGRLKRAGHHGRTKVPNNRVRNKNRPFRWRLHARILIIFGRLR